MVFISTIVIPIAPYHETLVERAVASAKAQTIPCDIVPYFDKDGRGAGYARNQGAKGITTPFLTFLDADDELRPTFIEECLAAYEKGGYVYTAWDLGNGEIQYPDPQRPMSGPIIHHVTTLFPTRVFEMLGGFDEDLPGDEDFDFFMRALLHGLCPIYVNEPLFVYHKDGRLSQEFAARPDFLSIHRSTYEKHGGQRTVMSNCAKCGGSAPISNLNECRPTDVRAIATWSGLSNHPSSVDPSRVYRGGNFQELCVAPEDVEVWPEKFKKVFSVADLTPDKVDVLKDAGLL